MNDVIHLKNKRPFLLQTIQFFNFFTLFLNCLKRHIIKHKDLIHEFVSFSCFVSD